MVPLGGLPAGYAVATDAVDRRGHVRGRFAYSSAAVVACGAVGRRGKQSVVRLSASPRCSGFVAILANRLAVVDGGCRLARSTEAGVGVAGGALSRYRDIGMEYARVPAGIARLVTAVTVGDRHAAERLVWNVAGSWTIRRRKAS